MQAGSDSFMASTPHNPAAYQPVRAPRGTALSCKGWQQEAVLRLLLNSVDPDVAERPLDLLISGAAGKAAADQDSLQSIIASLRTIESGETLLVKAGKPAGISCTTSRSARVIAVNESGGQPYGNWLYAGTQTALPVLYECYGAAARAYFGGTLSGKLVVGGGMGGAGGAQPLAAALHGAAFLGIDADAERIKRRVKTGYCEVMVNNLDEALRMLKNAVRQGKSVTIGLIGDCADVFPELARRGVVPDVLSDYTPAQGRAAAQGQAAGELKKLGTLLLDDSGGADSLGALFADGWRLATWLALSGEPADIARLDRLALEMFPGDERIQRWLPIAGKYVRFQGLPARVAWIKQRSLGRLAGAVNELVARGEISAPILFGCRLAPSAPGASDPGAAQANGSGWTWFAGDTSARWPNAASAQAIVADGTPDAAERLSHWTVP